MKKRFFLHFSVPLADGARFRNFVESIGCVDSWQEPFTDRGRPFLSHTFDESSPSLAALREFLKSEGIRWSEREEHTYTDAELRSFPLLSMGVDRKPIQGGGPEDGTTYDLSRGCPRCGTGAVQTSPLMVALDGLPKKGLLCATALDDILVGERLAAALREAKTTGLELRQAHFYRNNEPLPWWQMISDYCMPKMSPATRGIVFSETEPPCPECRRDERFGTPEEPEQVVYSRNDVDPDNIPDVVHTWECAGQSVKDPPEGRDPRYAQALILFKPKVFDIFRRLKVKHATFGPIRIMD